MKIRFYFFLLCACLAFNVNISLAQENVNPDLIAPPVTPGSPAVGDIQRTRQYYDSLENFSRRQKMEQEADVVPESEIRLPERTVPGARTIYVKSVSMTESAILTPDEVAQIKALVEDKDVTAEDLNNLIHVINQQYLKKNVITAKAYLPQVALKDGVLEIILIEAKIGKIEIKNNKYNRTRYLKSQIHLEEEEVFDIVQLENDLRQFNQNARGVSMTATLKAGEEDGTTDVEITAQEEFPLHMVLSFDNFGSKSSGENRLGGVLTTDSTFGFQDRFSVGYNWSSSSDTVYLDYNIPVNTRGTRVGFSYMYGDSDITRGPYRDFDIGSKTHTFSLYAVHPVIQEARKTLNFVTALNYKKAENDIAGFTYSRLNDVNLELGMNYQYKWDDAFLYTSHMFTGGYLNDRMIDDSMYFIKYNAMVFGAKYYDNGIAITAKLAGQYTPQDVPFVEQAQVGGMSTVRGYYESLLMGESNYVASIEALFPIPFLPKETTLFRYGEDADKKDIKYNFRENIKFAIFTDTGGVFRHHFTETSQDFITGIGAGLRIALSKHLQARVYWAYAVNHSKVGQPANRWHFDVIAAPF